MSGGVGGGRERSVAFAPGRVNLIGEHTDYNGGLSLPFAIEQGVRVTARTLGSGGRERAARIDALARDLDERDSFALADPGSALPAPAGAQPAATAGGWRAFVRGVVAELRGAGVPVPAAALEISGDVPRGAGLSSSAALSVSLALALLALSGDEHPLAPLELARLCSRVENDWVGAPTGLLDQLAALHGRRGHALRIDFASLDVAPVALELGRWRLVTLDSGESHSLAAGGGYSARRRECAEACTRLGVATLSEADPAAAGGLPDPLDRRARHVLGENERVDQTIAALRAGELARVGALLDASHASLRDLYDSSTPAIERTVARLQAAGAAGARMVGGGFGGHVLALLKPGTEPPPGAIAVTPGPGARLLGEPRTDEAARPRSQRPLGRAPAR